MKTCSKCAETKDLSEFSKDRSKRDGLRPECKVCKRRYYEENRERQIESVRRWREDNKERHLENTRRYYEDNKERIREAQRCYYEDNKERIRESNRRWNDENRERRLAAMRNWKHDNRDKIRTYRAVRRIRKLSTLTEHDLELSVARREAISNDPCFYCGTSQAEQYHVDHFFPISKGGDDRWSNLVRACEHCNLSKHVKCGTVFMLTLRKEAQL